MLEGSDMRLVTVEAVCVRVGRSASNKNLCGTDQEEVRIERNKLVESVKFQSREF